MRESFGTSGFLYYAWLIPYGIALIAFVVAYFNWLMKLPRRIMALFVVSGAIFVSGAVGCELLAGRHHDLYGVDNLTYAFFYTCEEFLEMFGIVIFIYTLLSYIAMQSGSLAISVIEE